MLKGGGNRSFNIHSDLYRSPFSRATKSNDGKLSGFPVRDIDAENLINRMTNIDKGMEYAIYNFIVNIKKDHGVRNLSDLFDCLYMFAVDKQANALLNWVSTSFNCSIVSSGVVFTPYVGFSTTVNTSYLTTNYIPSTNNVRFALQNCSFGAYVSRVGFKNSGFGFAQYFMTTSGTNPCVIAYFDFGVGIGLNGAASGQTGPATQQPFRGLISVVRKNNLLSQQNRGLDINTIQNAAVSQSTTAFTILARLSNTSFSTDTVGFAFIGSGDINIQALNRRVQEYMVAIGANVP